MKRNNAKALLAKSLTLGFVLCDGLLGKYINHKTVSGMDVYNIILLGQKEKSVVIDNNGIFSHGKTQKEAKENLMYKISNRDTTPYKGLTLKSKLTFAQAIQMYRVITGACEPGTKYFVERNKDKIKKSYTVQEVIDETKGQWGNEDLVNFFKGEVR